MLSKSSLLTSAAILALSSVSAFASDLPSKKAPASPAPVAAKSYDWSGFYVGVNAGYSDTSSKNALSDEGSTVDFIIVDSNLPTSQSLSGSGFTGGVDAGVNYQVGQFVFGVEADWSWMNNKDKYSKDFSGSGLTLDIEGAYNYTGAESVQNELSWLSTVRGRAGIAMDNLLIYGTGGFAFGGVKSSAAMSVNATRTSPSATADFLYDGTKSETATGWAAGGGLEYAFNKNMTAKAEYLYYDLGSMDYLVSQTTNANENGTIKVKTDGYLVRLGLNYRF